MREILKRAVLCLAGLAFVAPAALANSQGTFVAQGSSSDVWQVQSRGAVHFASVQGTSGISAVLRFKAGAPRAELLITGIWATRPLDLRLWVGYAGGRRAYIDTFRFAEIVEIGGKRAYKLGLPAAQLAPLRGGDRLVIEDLRHSAELPLKGSAAAISAAAKAAAGK